MIFINFFSPQAWAKLTTISGFSGAQTQGGFHFTSANYCFFIVLTCSLNLSFHILRTELDLGTRTRKRQKGIVKLHVKFSFKFCSS